MTTGMHPGRFSCRLKTRGVDRVDHPKRRGGRRHLPEQVELIAQRAQVGQAVSAIGEHHHQITQHDARIVG